MYCVNDTRVSRWEELRITELGAEKSKRGVSEYIILATFGFKVVDVRPELT